MTSETWVSVGAVAEDSIYTRIDDKHLPAHKVGRLWKFKLSEVDDWVRVGGAGAENPTPAGEEGRG